MNVYTFTHPRTYVSIYTYVKYSLGSFKLPKLVEPLPLACEAPVFPVELPPATADPAPAVADPGAPGGSANELVLGRPLPLILV